MKSTYRLPRKPVLPYRVYTRVYIPEVIDTWKIYGCYETLEKAFASITETEWIGTPPECRVTMDINEKEIQLKQQAKKAHRELKAIRRNKK